MFRRWVLAMGAVVLLLANSGRSQAQFIFMPVGFGNPVFGYGGYNSPGGWGYYPGGFPLSYTPRSYGAFSGYGPVSTGITNYQPPPTTSYVAFAGPGSRTGSTVGYVSYTIPDRPAQVNVSVPPGAELWFDGQRTGQGGSDRTFHTPPLEKGRGYHYEVRARWTEDGKTVEQTQSVPVTAGARVSVVFPRPKS